MVRCAMHAVQASVTYAAAPVLRNLEGFKDARSRYMAADLERKTSRSILKNQIESCNLCFEARIPPELLEEGVGGRVRRSATGNQGCDYSCRRKSPVLILIATLKLTFADEGRRVSHEGSFNHTALFKLNSGLLQCKHIRTVLSNTAFLSRLKCFGGRSAHLLERHAVPFWVHLVKSHQHLRGRQRRARGGGSLYKQ